MKIKDKLIEKQKELIIILTEALDFLADNNLIKEKRENNDTDNKVLIDCVNKSAKLKKEIAALKSSQEPIRDVNTNVRRRIKNAKTYDFVVKNKVRIYEICKYGNYRDLKDKHPMKQLINLARKEIGYSDKTWSGDIFNSLVNLYKKICV